MTKSVLGWFDDCKTMEELNRERQMLLMVINEEYSKQKTEIMKKIPPYKSIPVIYVSDIKIDEPVNYIPFPKVQNGEVEPNSVIFTSQGEVIY